MIKKALFGTAAMAVVGAFVFGHEMFSYARSAGSSVRNAIKSEVPVEFQIRRAREMVEQLLPEVRTCMKSIAEQEVDLDELAEKIARSESALDQQKKELFALKSDLESGIKHVVYAGRTFSANDVKRDLAQRFERFKIAQDTLDRNRQISHARRQAMESNQHKLENMLSAKKNLEVEIERLEARLKAVEAAETVSSLKFDDSNLARAKTLIRELNKEMAVREKLLDADGKFIGLIPVETEDTTSLENVVENIDEYFGGNAEGRVADRGESIPLDLEAIQP